MNSFLQLAELEIQEFEAERLEQVRQRVESRLRAQELIGDVLSLFFPVAGDTLTVMFGGEAISDDDDNLRRIPVTTRLQPPAGDDHPPLGPAGGPEDEIIR